MHKIAIAVMAAIAAASVGWSAHAQGGQAATPQAAAAAAPTNKAAYFDAKDIHEIWKDEEAKKVINKRVVEGGSHSINIRIVLPANAPLVHALSADT